MFALPLFAPRGALGGTRIMALLSLDCNGGRRGGRDGRERVGVALVSWLWEFSYRLLFLERFTEPRSAARILPFPQTSLALRASNPNHHYFIAERTKLTKLKESDTQRKISFHDSLFKPKGKLICLLAIL